MSISLQGGICHVEINRLEDMRGSRKFCWEGGGGDGVCGSGNLFCFSRQRIS